ncbi:MAG: hypothetical protein AUG20_01515 [Gemmatimonas sp. 13_1_20CM_3_60_15]|nr:MAG: hypothetical protein AUG20_01515 [Gemmatimonas sp. 13_1_20CM_3_60_15]
MPQSPQRPYVPHRTPTRGQPAISTSDFMLSKPFVPDAELVRNALMAPPEQSGPVPAESTVPSIESFLVAAHPTSSQPADAFEQEIGEELEELPPLEHFLDPLPPISEFSSESAESYVGASPDFPDTSVGRETSATADSDWVATDWQRYDWKSAGALGETERAQAEASDAWATTDWEVPAARHTERAQNPADAIATALDGIAERLRNGDLGLPGAAVSDPATVAATLAALLGVRR